MIMCVHHHTAGRNRGDARAAFDPDSFVDQVIAMPAENTILRPLTPMMSAEAEPETIELSRPMRVSGFCALALGLLSFLAVLGTPMLIVPVCAALLAIYALRPYQGPRPLGYLAASIGLFAAILFGVWSITERQLRVRTMTQQATSFAAAWLDLMAQGEIELAAQLSAPPRQRQPASMPLQEYYTLSDEGRSVMQEFREAGPVEDLIAAGDRVQWELIQQPVVFKQSNRNMVLTVWKDRSGTMAAPLNVVLEYYPAEGSARAQWSMDTSRLSVAGARKG
jgi:hypothetical protein